MSDAKNLFTKMNEDYQVASETSRGEAYSKLSTTLEKMDNGLREYTQELTLDDMKNVLKKLKSDENISSEELDQLKLWIIGDAQYYTKMENNYDDWINELKRVIDTIKELWTEQPDIETVLKIRGLVRDAIRTNADIFYYVQQKDRIEKFNDATQEIDQSERLVLVRLLEQKISSPQF